MFEFVKAAFDRIAMAVKQCVEGPPVTPLRHRRDIGSSTSAISLRKASAS